MLSSVQLATSVEWSEWFRLCSEAIDNYVPKYVVKDSSGAAWVDKELRQLQADILKKHRRAKPTDNTEDWENYRKIRNKVKSMCRSKHKLFIQDLGEAFKHNPVRFWSYAKSKLGRPCHQKCFTMVQNLVVRMIKLVALIVLLFSF